MTGSERTSQRDRVAAYVAAIALPLASVAVFGSAGNDDSYITYSSARSLLTHGAILNLNGARIEQSSSLVWTLAVALLALVSRLAIPVCGVLLSATSAVAAALVAGRVARAIEPEASASATLIAALAPGTVYWALSGMEMTGASLLLLGVIATAATSMTREGTSVWPTPAAAACVVALLGTRPEMPLVVGATLAGLLAALALTRGARRVVVRAAALLGLVVVVAAAYAAARKAYFGSWVPEPVLAKMSTAGLGERLRGGGTYLASSLANPGTAALLGLAIAFGAHEIRRVRRGGALSIPAALVVLTIGAELGFIVTSGGDWMAIHRFLVPALPVIAVAAACAARRWEPLRRPVTLGAVAVACALGIALNARDGTGVPFWRVPSAAQYPRIPWYERSNRVHFNDRRFLLVMMKTLDRIRERHPDKTIQIGSNQAGLVMFYVTRALPTGVRFVDADGLTTRDVSGCSAFDRVPHDSKGQQVQLPDLLSDEARRCDIDPDVVFNLLKGHDLYVAAKAALEQRGYRVIYARANPVAGEKHAMGVYMAVRAELAAELDAAPEE